MSAHRIYLFSLYQEEKVKKVFVILVLIKIYRMLILIKKLQNVVLSILDWWTFFKTHRTDRLDENIKQHSCIGLSKLSKQAKQKRNHQ